MSELSEVFSETDQATETVETDEAATAEPEETTEEVAESTVEDDATTTVAEQDEPEPQEESKDKAWTYAAYKDEKEKRQALEEKLRELESRQPSDDDDDDTDLISQSELKERLQADYDKKLQTAIYQDRYARTIDAAKAKYPDFDEKEKVFVDLVKQDQRLLQGLAQAQDPNEFAYVTATNHELLKKYNGNIMALVEDVKTQSSTKEPKKPSAPSLANATESEKTTARVEQSSSLEEIFADSQI